ncbi:MAG: hypothetical protein LBK63_12740 [Treponema sp.]|jgi:hypothetical protein|nr:hypothetical protein [Treponema sp.]
MPPLSIFNNRAFLVSPLEISVYLLDLPDMKDELLEGEIRKRLKALYPGAPENTELDYALFRRGNKTAFQTAAVYAGPRQTCETYRGLKRPLIPGTVLMRIGMGRAGIKTGLCVIATAEWFEAAFFEESLILRCGSCPAPSDGLPFSFAASFINSGKAGPAEALFIRAGSTEEQNEKTEKLLLQFFSRVTALDIGKMPAKGRLKNLGIFNDSRSRSLARQKRSAAALLFLSGVSLLLSLRGAAKQTRLELSQMEKQEKKQRETLDRAAALESEIAEMLTRREAEDRRARIDPYGVIDDIRSCLSGGWIKSLVIQGGNFELEAEGADSIEALRSMQRSGHFGELSLRRSSISPISGDQFAISGRAGSYEKK